MKRVVVAGNCGHAGIILETDKMQVVGYCKSYDIEDMSKFGAKLTGKGHKAIEYSDYVTMIEATTPDIVVVDTYFSEHYNAVKYALEHNISVFSDKPLAMTLGQCDALEELVEGSGGQLWAMQTLRYEDATYTAKLLLEEGVVGKIRMLNGQKSYKMGIRPSFFGKREMYGGTIPWVAIHAIDAITYLCKSRVKTVYAQHSAADNGGNGEMEVTSLCIFTMEDNVIAHVNADYYRPKNAPTHGDDRLRIVGTTGVLEMRGGKLYLINEDNDGTIPLELRKAPCFFEDFMESMDGVGTGLITAEQSINSTRIALMARESADSGEVVHNIAN